MNTHYYMIHWAYSIIILLFCALFLMFIYDIFQKQHTMLRTYPLIGYIRYIAEYLGVYLRQFFYARDREELPFNRAERTWVYEASKNIDTTVGFGSTRDCKPVGTIYFVDAPFPVQGRRVVKAQPVTIGQQSRYPYSTHSLINISAMSYGSISKNAILALSHDAKLAGCWLNVYSDRNERCFQHEVEHRFRSYSNTDSGAARTVA